MSRKASAVAPKTHKILMEAEVARQVRQHSRTSMKTEVCGVLIGKEEGSLTIVEACIAGANATQGGAHVTFTQDTWEHIYQIKDKKYPNDRIVGWYHSHPGFGVFLSDHDLFIHEHFFSSPQQIAWVYDPHNDEEGCFGWHEGKIEKIDDVAFQYSQAAGESLIGEGDSEDGTQPEVKVKVSWKDEWKGLVRDAVVCMLFFALGTVAMYFYLEKKAVLLPRGLHTVVIVDDDRVIGVPEDIGIATLDAMRRRMDLMAAPEIKLQTPGDGKLQSSPTPGDKQPNGTTQGGQDGRKK